MSRQTRKQLLETVSVEALRRLTPAENVKAGYSAKAERYVLKDAKVRKGMGTISKRSYLKRQTAEREGWTTPLSLEKAAQARREGGAGYSSAASAEQAMKTREARAIQRAGKTTVVRDFKGHKYQTGSSAEYAELREQKLNGELLDQRDWCAMMDIATTIHDPRLADLRSSAIVKR